MKLGEPAGQGQPQAHAALAAVEAAVRAAERLAHPRQHVRGDADTRVPDNEHRAIALAVDRHLEVDRAAAAGVLQGVAHEHVHDAPQPFDVGAHADPRGRQGGVEGQARPVRLRPAAVDHLAGELEQVHLPAVQHGQAAIEPGDFERLLDDPGEAVDLSIDHVVKLGGEPRVARIAPQQVQAVADRGQGVA